MRPLVSLSSRCTMPGRLTPPTPERLSPQWASSAFAKVPLQLPAAGCTTSPAGLSTTKRSASSNTLLSAMFSGAIAASAAGGSSSAMVAVIGVIGYRVFKAEGSAPAEVIAPLPKGARVVATALAEDRIVVTLDVGGAIEIRTFDAKTLKPIGRLKFASEP